MFATSLHKLTYQQFCSRVSEARDAVLQRRQFQPQVACILGSGLGGLAAAVADSVSVDYANIPGFTKTHAVGHAGKLITGYVGETPVVLMQGRSHRYEGHSHLQLQFPVHVMHALGAKTLIATNAAGGLNTRYEVGDLMVIDSHIDLLWRRSMWADPSFLEVRNQTLADSQARFGDQVLRGANPYTHKLIHQAKFVARTNNTVLHQGCYLGTLGPTYETRHEYRAFRWMGADAVGMSTIPEVLAARDLGMDVLAFSVITNVASTDVPSFTHHDEVVESGNLAGPRLQKIIEQLVPAIT